MWNTILFWLGFIRYPEFAPVFYTEPEFNKSVVWLLINTYKVIRKKPLIKQAVEEAHGAWDSCLADKDTSACVSILLSAGKSSQDIEYLFKQLQLALKYGWRRYVYSRVYR